MHARGSGEAARRAKLGREPIRVGGGLKKNFRPFGPQFGLKIRKNKGGGPPGSRPSPGSFTVDRRAGIFNDYRFIWENSRFSLLGGLLLAEAQPKHSTDEGLRNPPFLKETRHVHCACAIFWKVFSPSTHPFSPMQKFWGVRYARVPTHVSLFLLLIVAPKPVSIKSIRRKPAEKIKKQHSSFMPFIFPIK